MANKTFAEVQDFLKGKVILVANRGIPARRICRSIRERFDAVAAMTATDVDKTAPAASTAPGVGAAGQRAARVSGHRQNHRHGQAARRGGHPSRLGLRLRGHALSSTLQGSRYYLYRRHGEAMNSWATRSRRARWPVNWAFPWCPVPTERWIFPRPPSDQRDRPAHYAQGRGRRRRPGYFRHS